MAGIMDFFKAPATPAAATQQPNTQNTTGTQPENKDLSANPATTDKSGKMPGTDGITENPLDAYSKMFDNANNGSDLQAPTFKIDPKVLNNVSSKMDFTKGIAPEMLTKATSGDVSALMEIIKTVGQNSYRASLEHSTSLTDAFMAQRGEYEGQVLAKGVRSQLTSAELANAPNYNHPVVKAELNRIASQFAAANPDASPQEVAKAAQKYIFDLQAALNPADPTKNSDGSAKPEEMDWSKYLSE